MLSLESYRNYQVNIFYYLGKLGYELHKQLIIGGCNTHKLKTDIKLLNACVDFISCYDYPINILIGGDTTNGSTIIENTSDLNATFIQNFVGLDVSGTNIPSGAKITGVDIDNNRIYISIAATGSTIAGNVYIQNNRTNCIEEEDYKKVINLVNRILGTSYCVSVDLDY